MTVLRACVFYLHTSGHPPAYDSFKGLCMTVLRACVFKVLECVTMCANKKSLKTYAIKISARVSELGDESTRRLTSVCGLKLLVYEALRY
jgi:hypothetical protein